MSQRVVTKIIADQYENRCKKYILHSTNVIDGNHVCWFLLEYVTCVITRFVKSMIGTRGQMISCCSYVIY
jgi:sigma54-dependent transcription regulator